MLHGKYEARNRFRVQAHAHTGDAGVDGDDAVAHYPATEGLSSTQILALVREHAAPDRRRPGAVAGAALRARERLPDRGGRAARDPLSGGRGGCTSSAGAGWRSTSCCSPSWRCCAAGGCASGAAARRRSTATAR